NATDAGDRPADRPRPDHDAQQSGPDRHAALRLRTPGGSLRAVLGRPGRSGLPATLPPSAQLPPPADQQPGPLPPSPGSALTPTQGDHQHPPCPAAGRYPHQPLQPVPGRAPAPGPASHRRYTAARVARPDPRTASNSLT